MAVTYVSDTITEADETLRKLLKLQEKNLVSSVKTLENNIVDRAYKVLSLPKTDRPLMTRRSIETASRLHKSILEEFKDFGGDTNKLLNKDFKEVQKIIKKEFGKLKLPISFTTADKEAFKALGGALAKDFSIYGEEIAQQLIKDTYDYVIAGKPVKQIVDRFRDTLSGVVSPKGRNMAQYASLKVQDATMAYQTNLSLRKARDAGLNKFLYYGNIISGSRPFCIARAGRVFTLKQIQSWDKRTWKGKKPGPTIINRGGYNCRHSLHPVAAEWLDEDRIKFQDWWTEAGGMPDKLQKEVLKEEGVLGDFVRAATTVEKVVTKPKPKPKPEVSAEEQALKEWEKAQEDFINAPTGWSQDEIDVRTAAYYKERQSYYRYVSTFSDEDYLKERRKVLKALVPDSQIDPSLKVDDVLALVETGTDYVPFDILDRAREEKITFQVNAEVSFRAYYDPASKKCHVTGLGTSRSVAHEFAHAIDDRVFGTAYQEELPMGLGFNWKDNDFVTKADGDFLSFKYAHTHFGTKAKYTNGDGYFWEDNWLHNYEGRIYPWGSDGMEWWTMNCERYSDFLNKNISPFGSWEEAKQKYPELTEFIEKKFNRKFASIPG